MKKTRIVFSAAASLIFGCFAMANSPASSSPPLARLIAEKPFNFFESCERWPVTVGTHDVVTGKSRQVGLEIYRSRPSSRTKSVIIVPPSGGANTLDREQARNLCEHGIEAWLITEWAPGVADLDFGLSLSSHDQVARQGVSIVRQIVSLMPGKKGIIGASQGALIGSVALATEPKLVSGFFIAAGAGVADILIHSDVVKVVRTLKQRQLQMNISRTELGQQMQQAIRIDPLYFSKELKQKKIGLIMATQDKSVAFKNQLLFERISGGKRLGEFNQGHVATIVLQALSGNWKVIPFFNGSL